jgi:hypothetical protein
MTQVIGRGVGCSTDAGENQLTDAPAGDWGLGSREWAVEAQKVTVLLTTGLEAAHAPGHSESPQTQFILVVA